MNPEFSSLPPDEAVLPCHSQQPVPDHWIEIELIGEDGKPVPWQRFRAVLPSGETVEGALDDNGYARIDRQAQAGDCLVTFPDLDTEAVSFVESAAARAVR